MARSTQKGAPWLSRTCGAEAELGGGAHDGSGKPLSECGPCGGAPDGASSAAVELAPHPRLRPDPCAWSSDTSGVVLRRLLDRAARCDERPAPAIAVRSPSAPVHPTELPRQPPAH